MLRRHPRSLGDSFPWHKSSQETLQLQIDTNESLKRAGYCPIPASGMLDGSLCGARNFLTLKSQELFGKKIVFTLPEDCLGNEATWGNPTAGCYKASGMPLSKKEWILIGGAVSAVLAAWLMVSGVKGTEK